MKTYKVLQKLSRIQALGGNSKCALIQILMPHPHYQSSLYLAVFHSQKNCKWIFSLHNRPLWEDLKLCRTPLLLIVGEEDDKFKTIAKDMLCELGHVTWSENDPRKEIHDMVEVPKSGHAVHLENPLPVIRALRKFLTILERSSIPKERSL